MDVVLALVAFASQFATAYLGWRVTVDGVRPDRKGRYEVLFIICGVIGALSIGYATFRATEIAGGLAELKRGQTATNQGITQIQKNTSQGPVIITPPLSPEPRISKGFLQLGPVQFLQPELAPNAPLSVNIYLTNKGQEPIANVYHYGEIGLIGSTEAPVAVHERFLNRANAEYRRQLKSKIPGTAVGVGEAIWNTLGYQSITQEQFEKLKSDNLRFYIFAWARWKDEGGDLDQCVWLKVPETNNLSEADRLVWRDCIQSNLAH